MMERAELIVWVDEVLAPNFEPKCMREAGEQFAEVIWQAAQHYAAAAEAKSAVRIAELESAHERMIDALQEQSDLIGAQARELAALKAAGTVSKGYKLVPEEPTRAMWIAANKVDDAAYAGGSLHGADLGSLWAAMLESSPADPIAAVAEQIKQTAQIEIVPDWPACNPGCDYEDPNGMMHDFRSKHCECEAAKVSIARQRATQPSKE
jgi:hypothetical protein